MILIPQTKHAIILYSILTCVSLSFPMGFVFVAVTLFGLCVHSQFLQQFCISQCNPSKVVVCLIGRDYLSINIISRHASRSVCFKQKELKQQKIQDNLQTTTWNANGQWQSLELLALYSSTSSLLRTINFPFLVKKCRKPMLTDNFFSSKPILDSNRTLCLICINHILECLYKLQFRFLSRKKKMQAEHKDHNESM